MSAGWDENNVTILKHNDNENQRELLKNHDDIAKNTQEVLFVRDVETEKGCSDSGNINTANVTNCANDDVRDFHPTKVTSLNTDDDDLDFDKNFNYNWQKSYGIVMVPNENECDRNLIDLMDEGDNYVSTNMKGHYSDDSGGHLSFRKMHVIQPTIIVGLPFISTAMPGVLNNSEEFNYDTEDKISEITDKNEFLYTDVNATQSPKVDSKVEDAVNDDEKLPSNETSRDIFGIIDRHLNDAKNKFRSNKNIFKCRCYRANTSMAMEKESYVKLNNCFPKTEIVGSGQG